MAEEKKKFKVPHTYVILFCVIILAAIGSYILPPGEYTRVRDEALKRTIVDPNSFHSVERSPVTLFQLFMSVPEGMVKAAEIVFFIFICGGAFNIIQATGCLHSSISRAVVAMKGKETWMVPIVMLIFSIGGFTVGMSEEVIVFIPIGVALARATGYDDITAVAMMSTGAAIGFNGGMLNPFTVGVAQGIAELPLFSGIQFRWIGYGLFYVIAVAYTLRYAKRVKADPSTSYVADLIREDTSTHRIADDVEFTTCHKLVLLVFALGIAYMVYGVMKEGFYMMELATVFFGIGVIGGLVGRLSPSNIARAFVAGCQDIAFGALVVGISRGILVTMSNGKIIDTVIHGLAGVVSVLPHGFAAIGMFLVQSCINFFIPSGSGQAATTMPIMTPLADLVGITRQTAVLCFQYGDGLSNSVIPTSASLMGVLGMAKVPYERWLKFMFPLFLIWTAVACVLVYVAAVIKLGPF